VGFVAGLALGGLDTAVGTGTDGEGSPNVQSTLRVYENEEEGGQGVSDYALFWRGKLRTGVSTTRQGTRCHSPSHREQTVLLAWMMERRSHFAGTWRCTRLWRVDLRGF